MRKIEISRKLKRDIWFYNVYKPVKDTCKRWRSEKTDPPICPTNDSITMSFSSINLFLPIIPEFSYGSRKRNFKKSGRCIAYSEKLQLCGLRESYALHVRTTAKKYVFWKNYIYRYLYDLIAIRPRLKQFRSEGTRYL